MPIVRAAAEHLGPVQRLLHSAAYRYIDLGREDVPGLLGQIAVVGEEHGDLWGFLGLQVEVRPDTLPVDAPTRAHVRAAALQRHRQPNHDLPALFAAALTVAGAVPLQLICYGGDRWLSAALIAAGFQQVEAVQFYELGQLRRHVAELPPAPHTVTLSPAHPEHLAELAQLDGVTFPPLWHFGRRDLFEMLMRCRMQIAWVAGQMAGYSALCANTRQEIQLARLAVGPLFQGQGVGRALLADAVRYAALDYETLVLNTQTTNLRSQKLYRGFGFRTIGATVPVMARIVAQPVGQPGV